MRVVKFEDQKVSPVDMKALYAKLKEAFPGQFDGDKEPSSPPLAIIKDNMGNPYLVDYEFCGSTDDLSYGFHYKTGVSFSMFPVVMVTLGIEEFSLLAEVTVKDFMGSRFRYNDRIERNMAQWENFLYK